MSLLERIDGPDDLRSLSPDEIPVLAEGIETKAHLDFMRDEGCDEAQGYFLGRPMPVGQMFPQTGVGHRFRSEAAVLPGAAAAAAAE